MWVKHKKNIILITSILILLLLVVVWFSRQPSSPEEVRKGEIQNVLKASDKADSIAEKSNKEAAEFLADEYNKSDSPREKADLAFRISRYYFMDDSIESGNKWADIAIKEYTQLKNTELADSVRQLKEHSQPVPENLPDPKSRGSDDYAM